MNERLTTLLGAAVALVAMGTLFLQPSGEPPISRPTTEDGGRNGYRVLAEWLRAGQVPFESVQVRLDTLLAAERPATGNVLVTTMPHRLPWRLRESQAVRSWLRNGNTLVVLAALDDSPEWASWTAGTDFLEKIAEITGLRFVVAPPADADADTPPPVSAVVAGGTARGLRLDMRAGHPLSSGVETLLGRSDGPSAIWEPAPVLIEDLPLLLALADEGATGTAAMWHLPVDAGHIVVVASASLLVNTSIGRADNGRFFANIVDVFRTGEGRIVFDDMHQGLSSLYDPAAFFRDSRLHATVGILVLIWLAYLLGSSNRLVAPAPAKRVAKQSDMLRAVGGFLARRSDGRAVATLLLDEWLDDTLRTGAPVREDDWKRLQSLSGLGPALRERIEHYRQRVKSGRTVSLVRLHNLLSEARKAVG